MKTTRVPSHTSLQHVRNMKRLTDLTDVSRAAVCHHAGATDDLEVRDFGQLGQNIVLYAIGEHGVLFIRI